MKTRLAPSPVHGIGVFAREPISKGTPMWRLIAPFDLVLSREKFEQLPRITLEQIERYLYLDRTLNKIILCDDDARFYNHADRPNSGRDPERPDPGLDIALMDIAAGEEIVCDYRTFTDEIEF